MNYQKWRLVILCLLITFLFFGFSIYYLIIKEKSDIKDGLVYGEVYDSLKSFGDIRSNLYYQNTDFFLWVIDSKDNASSKFQLEISNITEIRIGSLVDGHQVYSNYSMINQSLIIDAFNGYFLCIFERAHIDIIYSDFYAINDNGYFQIKYHIKNLQCEGIISHDVEPGIDFKLQYTNVKIGNNTFYVNIGSFSFPNNQFAVIKLFSKGYSKIFPTPKFSINGSLEINNFKQISEDGIKTHTIDHLLIQSTNITVVTKIEPDCDEDHGIWKYNIPWTISISY